MPDFLPRGQQGLMLWTQRFASVLDTDPAGFGVPPAEATAYVALQAAGALAFRRATDPGTRTTPAVAAKDAAVAELKRETRRLARLVRAHCGRDGDRLARLGIKAASLNRRALPAPRHAPRLTLRPTTQHAVHLSLEDTTRQGKAMPRGVHGAVVMMFIGDTPPATLRGWTLAFGTTKTRQKVELPGGLTPGTRVWYTAYWTSPTGKPGPISAPASTRVGFCESPRLMQQAA
jgi:hypothetical protein